MDLICACSEPKLLEGHGRKGRGGIGGDFFYLDENNWLGLEWRNRFMGLRLSVDAAGTAKIGKCFHTGNMGFPHRDGTERQCFLTLVLRRSWSLFVRRR
jgi:hypothetical protein